LWALRDRGALLALDDVGAGWAGLRQIAELRPDIVKLDRSVVNAADRDEVKVAVVEMMLGLCNQLGSQLLVEGVETYDELDLFARLGVPLAQGWVFGQPAQRPPSIDDDLAVRLKFLAGLTRHADSIASLVDVTARTALAADPNADPGSAPGDAVILVDSDRRPAGVALRRAGAVIISPTVTALASDPLTQALLRAMTRPVDQRFDPLVCVDRAGRSIGLVRIDALARAAAQHCS
jgi:hypothetical protein